MGGAVGSIFELISHLFVLLVAISPCFVAWPLAIPGLKERRSGGLTMTVILLHLMGLFIVCMALVVILPIVAAVSGIAAMKLSVQDLTSDRIVWAFTVFFGGCLNVSSFLGLWMSVRRK